MTDTKDVTPKIKLPHNPSQTAIRNSIAPHAADIIRKLLYLMDYGDNDNVKLGSAKTLLAKLVPDLKTNDFQGEGVKQLAGLLTIIAQGNKTLPMAEPSSL